jgi:signal transduction histidine kinase
VGIAPEYLDRIFWLFERLSQENNSSTGMGLPIARKGIERMQGAIGVESTPGVGSRFWIELPSIEAHTL